MQLNDIGISIFLIILLILLNYIAIIINKINQYLVIYFAASSYLNRTVRQFQNAYHNTTKSRMLATAK